MKTIEIEGAKGKRPWHYHIAREYGDLRYWIDELSICEYVRHVLKGFLSICILIGLGALVGCILADTIMWWGFFLFTGLRSIEPDPFVVVGTTTILVVLLVVLFNCTKKAIVDWYYGYSHRKSLIEKPKQEPSFIIEAYRSFKDKVCIPVIIK